MKKVFCCLVILLFLVFFTGCFNSDKTLENEKINKHEFQDILEQIDINNYIPLDEYYIYGKHFNLKFKKNSIADFNEVKVVLKNDEQEFTFNLYEDEGYYKTSEYLNMGINLEKVPVGNYIILIKTIKDDVKTYYNLVNNTSYSDLDYYTMTKNGKNNHITMKFLSYNNSYYFRLNCVEEKLPEDVYDVVLDPGHGGNDSGAVNGKYKESTINLEYGLMLKEALEDIGLKVKMTREENINPGFYGKNTRTGIPYEAHAKLMLSLHLNSTNTYIKTPGIEVYTAYGDDYTFASTIAKNIITETKTDYSNNPLNRVSDGVYMRVYSKDDINTSHKKAKKGNYEPYDIDSTTTYYYFIRETGGYMTKGFNDGRNPDYDENIYRKNNIGVEAYLVELGYISSGSNLKTILNNKESYVRALKNSILEYINN